MSNEEMRTKLEQLPSLWEKTQFETSFFDQQRLRMDLLLLEEDTKSVVFRAATDWSIIVPKPLIKPEDMSVDEFGKQQDTYQLAWTNLEPNRGFVVENPKECF